MSELEALVKVLDEAQLIMVIQKDGTKIGLGKDLQNVIVKALKESNVEISSK